MFHTMQIFIYILHKKSLAKKFGLALVILLYNGISSSHTLFWPLIILPITGAPSVCISLSNLSLLLLLAPEMHEILEYL